MRRLARALVRSSIRAMPRRLRLFTFQAILETETPWWALTEAARQCPIDAIAASGSIGTILGSPGDRTLLRRYAEEGTWAERTNALLTQFFESRGGQYVDVGANIGLTMIPVAHNLRVQCIGIEPEPVNFRCLNANIAANCRHADVTLHECAASVARGTARLEIAINGNGVDHRLRLADTPGLLGETRWRTIAVKMAPLDDLVPPYDGPLAVKIDTQGAEPYVVAGGSETLDRADLVILEWGPYWLRRVGGDPSIVTDYLRRHFTHASIAEGESGIEVPPPLPIDAAVNLMLESAATDADNPNRYFDVIAVR